MRLTTHVELAVPWRSYERDDAVRVVGHAGDPEIGSWRRKPQ